MTVQCGDYKILLAQLCIGNIIPTSNSDKYRVKLHTILYMQKLQRSLKNLITLTHRAISTTIARVSTITIWPIVGI